MDEKNSSTSKFSAFNRNLAAMVLFWTLLTLGSLIWDIYKTRQDAVEHARNEALATFNKDQAFRSWATKHGGVYVPITDETPPNPYLKDIPDRDIQLPSGKPMTLMNPAYMLRQAMGEYENLYGVKGHITSLKPLNPINKPDEWERKALEAFERGEEEVVDIVGFDGTPHLRLIRPMVTKKGCLKCHEFQGYEEGDIRGGVSVSVPMAPYFAVEKNNIYAYLFSHVAMWLIGIIGITGVAYIGRRGISSQAKAEEALLKSEEQLRAFFSQAIDGCFFMMLDGPVRWDGSIDKEKVLDHVFAHQRITQINDAMLAQYGANREQMMDLTPNDLFEHDIVHGRDLWRRCFDAGNVHLESHERKMDGTPIWVEGEYIVLHDSDGRITGHFGIQRDVTERKRAETTRMQLAAIVESSNDAIIGKTTDGVITSWNKGAEKIYGYSADEIIGKPVTVLAPPERSAELLEMLEKTCKGETVVNYESERIRKDGARIQVALTLSPMRDTSGNIIGISTIARDVTERKRAEDNIRKSETSLKRAQEVAHIGSWFLDLTKNELLWTDESYHIFGVPEGTSLTYERFLETVHPDDREYVHMAWTAAMNGAPYDIEHRLFVEGGTKWVREKAKVEFDEKGKALRGIGITHDITDRKLKDEELRKYREHLEDLVKERTSQLEATNKELEAFSYSVSHDLRAPLRAIDGFSKIIMEDYFEKLDEDGKKDLAFIRSNAQKMEQLIDDILAFSRMGRKEIMQSEIDMNQLARAVFDEVSLVNQGRSVQFNLKDLPPANGDTAMINQVYTNLFSNAFKFTRKKDIAIIEAGGWVEEKENIYYVKDNGAGFDMNYVEKIFGVFQRLHSAEEFEGSGVGLAIFKRIIQRHGGRVWAEGKVNEGATFYFTLPKTY